MRGSWLWILLVAAPALASDASPTVVRPFPTQDRPVPLAAPTPRGVPVPGALEIPRLGPSANPSGPAWWVEFLGREPDPQAPPPGVPSAEVQAPTITARTLPPPPPRPEPYSDEEIVVYGDRIEAARARVARRLTDLGYEAGPTRNGRTTWKPTEAGQRWKPRVTIDDDGWFEVGAPVVSSPTPTVSDAGGRAGGFDEAPAFQRTTPLTAPGIGGTFAGRRLRQNAEARVVRQVFDVVADLARAHQEAGLMRTVEALPDRLDRIWRDGIDEDGTPLPTDAERQAALLTLWANRTRTREGETVRRLIAAYLLGEVDPEVPLHPALVRAAESRCGCTLE